MLPKSAETTASNATSNGRRTVTTHHLTHVRTATKKIMKATRIYSRQDGKSAFEDFEIELENAGDIGNLSKIYNVTGIIFRETDGDYDYNWHNAPQRQFVLMLEGEVDITSGEGETRRFGTGGYTSGRGYHR